MCSCFALAKNGMNPTKKEIVISTINKIYFKQINSFWISKKCNEKKSIRIVLKKYPECKLQERFGE